MLKKALNDRALNALKPAPAGTRYVVWDSALQNFGVRVTENGHRSFFVMRRLHGKLRRWSLGQYPALGIEKARTTARGYLESISGGVDPAIKQERIRREEEKRHKDTFSMVAEEFIKRHTTKLRRGKECEAVVRRELCSRWGKLPISEITRRDVVTMLEEVMERGHAYAAHHALSYTRKLFNWAVARDIYGLEHSPCDRIKPAEMIGKKLARQRILADKEIRAVWAANEKMGYPFGSMVKLLFLTGLRLREVAEMSWSEIDLQKKVWTIPASRMKSDSTHVVPLSPDAVTLLQSLPRWTKGDFVLTSTDGRRPVSGFSKAKSRLDAQILKDLTEVGEQLKSQGGAVSADDTKFNPWRFHDIRRTMRTNLSALPVQDIVRELVISHTKKGLHKVYDQWAYLDEKREALELWGARLRDIVTPPPPNVVSIKSGKKALSKAVGKKRANEIGKLHG